MRKSKLDTPHIKEMVVKKLAVGESQESIAKDVGLNQSQVSRWIANREDIRSLIQQQQMKLLEAVPDAVENIKSLVREMKDLPEDDHKRKELAYKASKDILKCVGIMPTPIQSQTLVNIFQENKKEVISPKVLEIIGKVVNPENKKK